MDTGKAIFFGLALIALAVFSSDMMKPAEAGLMGSGRYVGLQTPVVGYVNIVDTETGAVRLCVTLFKTDTLGCRDWVGK